MELFGSAELLSLCSLSPSQSTDQQHAPLSHDLDLNALFLSGQHSAGETRFTGCRSEVNDLRLNSWLSSHFFRFFMQLLSLASCSVQSVCPSVCGSVSPPLWSTLKCMNKSQESLKLLHTSLNSKSRKESSGQPFFLMTQCW